MPESTRRTAEFPEKRGVFLEHFLRAYAPALPWYKAPQLTYSPLTAGDFCTRFHRTFAQAIQPLAREAALQQSISLGRNVVVAPEQSLSYDRRLMRHLSYKFLKDAVQCHIAHVTPSFVQEGMRQELHRISSQGVMFMETPHHILYQDSRANPVSGIPMGKTLRADAKDREFARWLAGPPLDALLEGAKEFTIASKDCRVVEYGVKLRGKLRTLLQGKDALPAEVRSECFKVLLDEWDMLTRATHLEERAKAVMTRHKLGDILDEKPGAVLEQVHPSQLATRAQEEDWRPVYEQSLMHLTNEEYSPELEELTVEWSKAMMRLGIPACDRPSLSMAILAMELHDPEVDIQSIVSRL